MPLCVHLENVGANRQSVGQKSARLAEIFGAYRVPAGFVLTSRAYEDHVQNLPVHEPLKDIDVTDLDSLLACSNAIKTMITGKPIALPVLNSVKVHARRLGSFLAIRSSSVQEDTKELSFAGQYDSFLDVRNNSHSLEEYIKACWASLYTPRVISYRHHNKLPQENLSTAVLIQNMVHGLSGVLFTSNPNDGSAETLIEFHPKGVVQGNTKPHSVVLKSLVADVSSLGDLSADHQRLLYQYGMKLSERFQCPLDIEWCLDKGTIFILQVRPLKVGTPSVALKYSIPPILLGSAVGSGLKTGVVQKLSKPNESFKEGSVLVVETTSPEWEPVMRRASGLITDKGSQTSHASLVAREMGLSAVVGTMEATSVLKNGQTVTLNTSDSRLGLVYGGEVRV